MLLGIASICASQSGCSNTCVVGFSNNGNAGVIVKAGDPPPACSLSQAQGMVRATLAKLRVCETCAPVARAQHIFITLRGIQVHADVTDSADSTDWVELALQLKDHPRVMDLAGDSLPEEFDTVVPAGTYRLVRLQFAGNAEVDAETPCGSGVANCLVMGDGQVVPLRFRGEMPELLLPASSENGSLVVLDGSDSEVQIRLRPQTFHPNHGIDGDRPGTALVGEVAVLRKAAAN
jgi:hypothetical protein